MYLSENISDGIPIVDDVGAGVQNLLSKLTGGFVPQSNVMPGETGGIPDEVAGEADDSGTASTAPLPSVGISTTTIIGVAVIGVLAWWALS